MGGKEQGGEWGRRFPGGAAVAGEGGREGRVESLGAEEEGRGDLRELKKTSFFKPKR